MMKIFVYEYVCATWRPGMETSRAAGLLAEGRAMRDAALADAAAIPNAEARTLDSVEHEEREFRKIADWCDYALVIAPEFDAILETRVRWAEECGAKLLGPSSDAVALCADKLRLAEVWDDAGVPTPPTKPFDPWAFPPPVVVKPRYGAGAMNTHRFDARDELLAFAPKTESIIQPFVGERSYSMAFLLGPAHSVPLCLCMQDVSVHDNRMNYSGGSTFSSVPKLARQAVNVAGPAVAAANVERGYVGVDLIFDGRSNWTAIEINPRLTTSYLGLRKLYWCNLMETLIAVVRGESVPEPACRSTDVQFDVHGNEPRTK